MSCPTCGNPVYNPVESTPFSTASAHRLPPLKAISGTDPDQSLSQVDLLANPAGARSKGFASLIEIFSKRWARSYGRPYPVSAGDRAQLGRFMRDHGNYCATFGEIVDRYVSDRRNFLIERSSHHTLRWLVTMGLAMYGGKPLETAEAFAARLRMEHKARKRTRALKPQSKQMQTLIAGLAEAKAY